MSKCLDSECGELCAISLYDKLKQLLLSKDWRYEVVALYPEGWWSHPSGLGSATIGGAFDLELKRG